MEEEYLIHHGVLGQKWGVRRFQNTDGTLTPLGKKRYKNYSESDTVFLSGKVKFDKEIPDTVKSVLDSMMNKNVQLIIGDAPGADTRIQEYLEKKKYAKVEVYSTDDQVRNNVGNWKVNYIRGDRSQGEKEWRALKDKAMYERSNHALAISSEDDRPDSATSLNIKRMESKGAPVRVYDYKTGKWIYK